MIFSVQGIGSPDVLLGASARNLSAFCPQNGLCLGMVPYAIVVPMESALGGSLLSIDIHSATYLIDHRSGVRQ